MKLDTFKENLGSFWESLADGWRQLTQSASTALTRFRAGDKTNLPSREQIDDINFTPSRSWAVVGGDLFEDEHRLVVLLELPGVDKHDLNLEVRGDSLVVSGEKRFAHEATEGRWRVMQRAYGAFHRSVPLPLPVRAEQAKASYRDGVLRVELPKAHPGKPRLTRIPVS